MMKLLLTLCLFLGSVLPVEADDRPQSEVFLQEQVYLYGAGNVPKDKINEYNEMKKSEHNRDALMGFWVILCFPIGSFLVYKGMKAWED